jgi:hypothetical protein
MYGVVDSLSLACMQVLIQSGPDGPLANFRGAHSCGTSAQPHVNGVQDWDREAIRDSQGRVTEGSDPSISEPLVIARNSLYFSFNIKLCSDLPRTDFDQRTLEDCKMKLARAYSITRPSASRGKPFLTPIIFTDIADPNNWRVINGGPVRCSRLFIPTRAQIQSGIFSNEPDYSAIMEIPDQQFIYDRSLPDSWYGRQTSMLLEKLRAGGSLPLVNAAAASASIEHITVKNPM